MERRPSSLVYALQASSSVRVAFGDLIGNETERERSKRLARGAWGQVPRGRVMEAPEGTCNGGDGVPIGLAFCTGSVARDTRQEV